MNDNIMLITGASRGIGAETAHLAAASGYKVAINFKSDEKSAKALVKVIERTGGEAFLVQGDVSKEKEVLKIFKAIDKEGRLTCLVNNVGVIAAAQRLDNLTYERLTHLFQTNLFSAFSCARESVKRMSSQYDGKGGSIVNVSSAQSRLGSPYEYIDYAATKGAMDTLTRGLSLEVANEGIRVNSVRPGFIHTTLHKASGDEFRVEKRTHSIPMNRGGDPMEVAEAIIWLASEKASFVTGSFIDIAGGL